jgi:hypothetical protein
VPSAEAVIEWVAANPDKVPKDERGKVVPLFEDNRHERDLIPAAQKQGISSYGQLGSPRGSCGTG